MQCLVVDPGLEGLQQLDLVCVDDFDRVAGNATWERALFRCFNEVRAAQGRLLVSSRLPSGLKATTVLLLSARSCATVLPQSTSQIRTPPAPHHVPVANQRPSGLRLTLATPAWPRKYR